MRRSLLDILVDPMRPLHRQPCFDGLGYRNGDFSEARRAAREMLSLLVYAELSSDQQAVMVDAIAAFHEGER